MNTNAIEIKNETINAKPENDLLGLKPCTIRAKYIGAATIAIEKIATG